MMFRSLRLIPSLILIFILVFSGLFVENIGVREVQAQSPAIASLFSPPLGYRDGLSYGPRINYSNGQIVENTDYGVVNPDMQGNTCFNQDWGTIYHAGEDIYRTDGQSTANAEVTAVADGIVKFRVDNFPGAVLIIEHSLPPDGQQKIYSLYGHLNTNSVIVSVNQSVVRGQKLGTIYQQFFDGRYTDYHDDSHLHFEMRYFYDATNIYTNYPNCNGYLPGRGYSYPQHPNNFPPSLSQHYTDPTVFVINRQGVFLPIILKQEPTCVTGQQLLTNRGFESGTSGWVELRESGYAIITDYLLPTTAYSGTWVAWFGGRNNATERIYQEFTVTSGMTGANLSYYVWIGTDETTTGVYDKLYVRLRDSSNNIIQQLDYLDDNALEHVWLPRSTSLPNLSSRVGQILRLSFEGTTDGSLITHFLVDNTNLTAMCSGSYAPQPIEQNALPTNQPQRITGGPEPTRPSAPTPTLPPYPNP